MNVARALSFSISAGEGRLRANLDQLTTISEGW